MTRILFHLGDRKTGTSSLQSVLDQWDRSGAAAAQGVLYPRSGRRTDSRINHGNLARELTGDARFDPSLGSWADLAHELRASDAPVTIISSEAFESVDPVALRAAIDRHLDPAAEVTLLGYFRPHHSRILASYTQNTKVGSYFGTLAEFARSTTRRRFSQVQQRFAAWRAVFGAAYRLRLYQRDRLLMSDIVADVLVRELGLDARILPGLPASQHENPSPRAPTLEVLRLLAATLDPVVEDTRRGPRKVLSGHVWTTLIDPLRARLDALADTDAAPAFDVETAGMIHAACLDDARAIDRDFFPDAPGVEAALDAALAAAHRAPPPVTLSPREAALHAAYREALLAAFGLMSRIEAAPPSAPPAEAAPPDEDKTERRARRRERRAAQ